MLEIHSFMYMSRYSKYFEQTMIALHFLDECKPSQRTKECSHCFSTALGELKPVPPHWARGGVHPRLVASQ